MSCHAEEVLEANRALQVMRGREQLLRFARPRLPIQNPADVHQLFSWAPFKRRQPEKGWKRLPKVPKKNPLQITCQFQQFVAKFCCATSNHLRTKRQERVDPCWSMLMPYAASFTKAGVSPEEIEEAKQMLETDAWIRLDQIGSGWIRLDQIGSGWIRLDWWWRHGIWPGMAIKNNTTSRFPHVLNPKKDVKLSILLDLLSPCRLKGKGTRQRKRSVKGLRFSLLMDLRWCSTAILGNKSQPLFWPCSKIRVSHITSQTSYLYHQISDCFLL